jgi:hypothetical protein
MNSASFPEDTACHNNAGLSRCFFRHLGNPVPYDANRLLEGIDILKITVRHPDLAGVCIDVLDFIAPLRNVVCAGECFSIFHLPEI